MAIQRGNEGPLLFNKSIHSRYLRLQSLLAFTPAKHVYIFEALGECSHPIICCSCGNVTVPTIGLYELSQNEQLILDICCAEVTAKMRG